MDKKSVVFGGFFNFTTCSARATFTISNLRYPLMQISMNPVKPSRNLPPNLRFPPTPNNPPSLPHPSILQRVFYSSPFYKVGFGVVTKVGT